MFFQSGPCACSSVQACNSKIRALRCAWCAALSCLTLSCQASTTLNARLQAWSNRFQSAWLGKPPWSVSFHCSLKSRRASCIFLPPTTGTQLYSCALGAMISCTRLGAGASGDKVLTAEAAAAAAAAAAASAGAADAVASTLATASGVSKTGSATGSVTAWVTARVTGSVTGSVTVSMTACSGKVSGAWTANSSLA